MRRHEKLYKLYEDSSFVPKLWVINQKDFDTINEPEQKESILRRMDSQRLASDYMNRYKSKLLTKNDVCSILSISQSTINRMISSKTVPTIKLGGRVLFSKDVILGILSDKIESGYSIKNGLCLVPGKQIYSMNETIRALCVSRATIERMWRTGGIKTITIGARRFFPLSEIERLSGQKINEQEQNAIHKSSKEDIIKSEWGI